MVECERIFQEHKSDVFLRTAFVDFELGGHADDILFSNKEAAQRPNNSWSPTLTTPAFNLEPFRSILGRMTELTAWRIESTRGVKWCGYGMRQGQKARHRGRFCTRRPSCNQGSPPSHNTWNRAFAAKYAGSNRTSFTVAVLLRRPHVADLARRKSSLQTSLVRNRPMPET